MTIEVVQNDAPIELTVEECELVAGGDGGTFVTGGGRGGAIATSGG